MENTLKKEFIYEQRLTTASFFDYDICDVTYRELLKYLLLSLEHNRRNIVLALNPKKMVMAEESDNIKQALEKADILIPDGYGIILASKIFGKKIENRITGVDLMMLLCDAMTELSFGAFIYGASPESLKGAVEKLRDKGINICGGMDGYDHDDEEVVDRINKSGASILFVALGSPKQELFIYNNSDKLAKIKLIIGVGGSVDVISGYARRAPAIIRKIGLEWMFRMLCKPARVKENKALVTYIKMVFKARKRKRDTA